MLLVSNFMLNAETSKESIDIFPYIHSFSHLKYENQAFKKV